MSISPSEIENSKNVYPHHFYSASYWVSSQYDKARQRNESNKTGKEIKLLYLQRHDCLHRKILKINKISTRIYEY